MKQRGFLDLPEHLKRLSESDDPLEEMAGIIDFEAFRPLLEEALAYSDGARRAAAEIWPDNPRKAAQKDTDARSLRQAQRSRHATGRRAAVYAGLRAPSGFRTD